MMADSAIIGSVNKALKDESVNSGNNFSLQFPKCKFDASCTSNTKVRKTTFVNTIHHTMTVT